jgi:Flp pilus assembly protein TadD
VTQATPRGKTLAAALVLLLGTLAAYARVGGHEFVHYDDDVYVYENEVVLEGLTVAGVRWAFTTGHAGNWHPVTWLSHMLDVSLFGAEPGGHHLTSAVLHALNGVLLFFLLARATGRLAPSFVAAALFAWHPLRVESVAWVSERKDVLAGLFFLLTLLAYLRWARGSGGFLPVVAALALGLLAKPMLVSVPLVLVLLDRWPLGRSEGLLRGARWREKLPLLALCLGSAVVTVLIQRAAGAVAPVRGLSALERALNALASVGTYARQTAWPLDLACFYPHASTVSDAPVRVLLLPALASLAVLGFALAWAARRGRPALLVGLAWTLVMLLPVIGIVQVGSQAHADRYTYLPTIGLALGVVFVLADGLRTRPALRLPAAGLSAALLAGALVLTERQVRVWRDSTTLFEHALAVTEENHVAHGNLGYVLLVRGEFAEAEAHLFESVRIHDGDPNQLLNLGFVSLRLGKLDQARDALERAGRLVPGDSRLHSNLGELHLRSGDGAASVAAFETALGLGSTRVSDRVNLGMAALVAGDLEKARRVLEEARTGDPTDPEPVFGLGAVALEAGEPRRARELFETTLALDPTHADAHHNLGLVLEVLGDRRGAVEHYRAGGTDRSRSPAVRQRLAWLLATAPESDLRSPSEALELARELVRTQGGRDPRVQETVAAAQAALGRFAEAVEAQERAVGLLRAGRRAVAEERLELYRSGRALLDGE